MRVVRVSGYGRGIALVATGMLISLSPCRAVLFKSTSNVTYNTTAPGGSLTNSGWQYEGYWGNFIGTPIGPTFFVAAKHVGGSIGDVFALNGFSYHAVTNYPDPSSDLQIWQVAETFPDYALLYTNTNELINKHCVVFGRGTQRGNPVIVDKTNGWAWGASDGVKRWGENDVAFTNNDPNVGPLLRCVFDRNGASNECHLSTGDSSGGLFILDGATWKLAGIHYAVDTPIISTNGVDGTGFPAAMMDYGGVYIGGDGNWSLITNQTADIPATFYSSRISYHLAWINSVIDFEPGIDLQITGIQQVSTNVLISFMTGTNKIYRVDRRDDLKTGTWTTLTNGIVGTGGIMTATDFGAATLSNRFYRLLLVP